MPSLNTIPIELILDIFEKLGYFDLIRLQRVCKAFHAIIKSQKFGPIAKCLLRSPRHKLHAILPLEDEVGLSVRPYRFALHPCLSSLGVRHSVLGTDSLAISDLVPVSRKNVSVSLFTDLKHLGKEYAFYTYTGQIRHPVVMFDSTAKTAAMVNTMTVKQLAWAIIDTVISFNKVAGSFLPRVSMNAPPMVSVVTPSKVEGPSGEWYSKLINCRGTSWLRPYPFLNLSLEFPNGTGVVLWVHTSPNVHFKGDDLLRKWRREWRDKDL